jgi:hypothetical protein
MTVMSAIPEALRGTGTDAFTNSPAVGVPSWRSVYTPLNQLLSRHANTDKVALWRVITFGNIFRNDSTSYEEFNRAVEKWIPDGVTQRIPRIVGDMKKRWYLLYDSENKMVSPTPRLGDMMRRTDDLLGLYYDIGTGRESGMAQPGEQNGHVDGLLEDAVKHHHLTFKDMLVIAACYALGEMNSTRANLLYTSGGAHLHFSGMGGEPRRSVDMLVEHGYLQRHLKKLPGSELAQEVWQPTKKARQLIEDIRAEFKRKPPAPKEAKTMAREDAVEEDTPSWRSTYVPFKVILRDYRGFSNMMLSRVLSANITARDRQLTWEGFLEAVQRSLPGEGHLLKRIGRQEAIDRNGYLQFDNSGRYLRPTIKFSMAASRLSAVFNQYYNQGNAHGLLRGMEGGNVTGAGVLLGAAEERMTIKEALFLATCYATGAMTEGRARFIYFNRKTHPNRDKKAIGIQGHMNSLVGRGYLVELPEEGNIPRRWVSTRKAQLLVSELCSTFK